MDMVCQAMNSWTFCDLVAAFLDLSIAYFLLCASSLAFFATKLLGLFGLCLPCPCDGLFWNPRNNQCLQKQLVDCPYEKISSVQFTARSKFPFDSIWDVEQIENSGVKLGNESNHENRHADLEFAASSSSFPQSLQDLSERDSSIKLGGGEFGTANLDASKEDQYDNLKGKRVQGRRLRHGLRRRRRGASVGYGKLSPFSSYDTFQSDARNTPHSPSSISKFGKEVAEDSSNYGDGREATTEYGSADKVSLSLELSNSIEENTKVRREVVSVKELGCDALRNLNSDDNQTNMIRTLEQALEEEHAARSNLYLELEKERSAAATAADEAMAMILRLQEEKQILLRREREKHFLEKEVEAYRQMILGNEQSDFEIQDATGVLEHESSTVYSKQDPLLMLEQINDFSEKPKVEVVDSSLDYELASFNSQSNTLTFGKELEIPQLAEDIDSHSLVLNSTKTNDESQQEECTIDENIVSQQKEVERLDGCSEWNDLTNDLPSKAFDIPCLESTEPPKVVVDAESHVFDVHVIDDESKVSNKVTVRKSENQSSSDISSSGLPPKGNSREKFARNDMRRNSMSAVDYERLKIENEVEWLRERLRKVQEGREKLNFSVGHREREKLQLQLLEDIAGQLREIRQLNEPGKVERQASLPPAYSKALINTRPGRRCVGVGQKKVEIINRRCSVVYFIALLSVLSRDAK
uniref:GTD-binding domain-containing protein n=1 Tax=Cannabis sativa TaxID=3483 RepID=A0A803Q270_CANSA